MKPYLLCIVATLWLSCKTSQTNTSLGQSTEKQIVETKDCINNATCTLEIIPKSSLLIKQDEFNNTYIEIEKGESTILKYQLKKDPIPNTADSNYSEILYFQIDGNTKELHLINEELKKVNMVYARLCYCKGTSGYFKVRNGELKLSIKKNELTLSANFSVENIPQIITQINEKIILQK